VLQSSLTQVQAGAVTVTNGSQVWQYDPTKKVVYHGSVPANAGAPAGGSRGVGQSRFILNLLQTVFTRSDATLASSNTTVNGHQVYDLRVISQGGQSAGSRPGNFNYDGDIYVDKNTQLPVQVNLNLQGFGKFVLDMPMLVLNQAIPDSTFVFVVPSGVKVLPLQLANPTPGTGELTLAQAQLQAGYHLLSVPASQSNYVLGLVNALGAPGNQIYTLTYHQGNNTIIIAEGKPLANLPGAGQTIGLRGTSATLTSAGGATTLAWTENGVGIRITGPISNDQAVALAKSLS
jgi:outer membrane lipoprotein-sorting protein